MAFQVKQISEDKEPGCLFLMSLWEEWVKENSHDSRNQCYSEFVLLWSFQSEGSWKTICAFGLLASHTLILCHISTVLLVFREILYLISLACVCVLELFSTMRLVTSHKGYTCALSDSSGISTFWLLSNLPLEQSRFAVGNILIQINC